LAPQPALNRIVVVFVIANIITIGSTTNSNTDSANINDALAVSGAIIITTIACRDAPGITIFSFIRFSRRAVWKQVNRSC
jgi:orotate phosphoribosyltransferase-like protein